MTATMTDFTIHFLEVGSMPGPNGGIQRNEIKAAVTLPLVALEGLQQVIQQLLQQMKQAKPDVEKLRATGVTTGVKQ